MSIHANLIRNGIATTSRFIGLQCDVTQYTNNIEDTYHPVIGAGGNDHFVSTIKQISKIAEIVNNPNHTVGEMTNLIDQTPLLRSWFCACVCAMLYPFSDGNDLDIYSEPFSNNLPFLEKWSLKLTADGANMNVADPFSDFNSANSLNFISFNKKKGYESWLGCLSSWCFVIPMKDYFADINQQNHMPWKRQYKKMMDYSGSVFDYLNSDAFNIRHRVILKMTAANIEADAQPPIIALKEILSSVINIKHIAILGLDPVYKNFCGIHFYNTEDIQDLDNLINKTLYVGSDNRVFYSLYPFTYSLVQTLKKGEATIENIKFVVNQGERHSINSADFSFTFKSKLKFIVPANVPAAPDLDYTYDVKRTYAFGTDYPIQNLKFLRTMCMFPNISIDYESRCKKFVFLGINKPAILLDDIDGTNAHDGIDEVRYFGSPDNDTDGNNRVEILKTNDTANITKAYDGLQILRTELSSPIHFIEVVKGSTLCGFIMNLRCVTTTTPAIEVKDVPAILEESKPGQTGVNITLVPNPKPRKPRMDAYVDFGSSTSTYRYRIPGGDLSQTSVKDSSIMRMLLAGHSKDKYSKFINDPEENNSPVFMSVALRYDPADAISDFTPYISGWMPVIKSVPDHLKNLVLEPSYKTTLTALAANPSNIPSIIISNLCYTIACNAIAENCDRVVLIPSLPSQSYKTRLEQQWNNAINIATSFFSDLTICNALQADDIPYLYESIAVSNASASAPGCINVCIDMGDGTTDMSAVFNDGKESHLVGYSSIEYAGRDLIKATIKDVIVHSEKEQLDKRMKSHLPYGQLFIKNDNITDEQYGGKADNFINCCPYKGADKNISKDLWESRLVDILYVSKLSSTLDPKIGTDLIFRYLLLIPVVKDFIKVAQAQAQHICESREGAQINSFNITFTGGASKGFMNLNNLVDSKMIADNIIQYFRKEFGKSVNVFGVSKPLDKDGKDLIIDGLSNISVTPDTKPVIKGTGKFNVVWGDVDPENYSVFGNPDSIHKNCLKKPFAFDDSYDAAGTLSTTNQSIIRDANNHYDTDPDLLKNETKDYLENEIINKLISPNKKYGMLEVFLKGLTSENSNSFLETELNGISDDSFMKACNQSIYPEMIKNAAFMYAFSSLLTKSFGNLKENGMIMSTDEADTYKFGS